MINTQSYFQIILAVSGIYWTMDVTKAITEKDGLKVRINNSNEIVAFSLDFVSFRVCFEWTRYQQEMFSFVLCSTCSSFLELFKTKQ